jgi:tetratricopeptide (TPR) repeat protein
MGDIYLITQNFPEAEKCNQRMYEIVQKTGDKQGMCYAIGDRGIVCSKMGRLEEAIECYKEKLVIAHELGDGYNIWEGLINMGRDYMYLKDYIQAEATINLAIDTARVHQLKRELCVALLAKVDLYLELSRTTDAQPILKEATDYADQLEEEGLIFKRNLYSAQLDYAAGDMDAENRLIEKITEETPETDRAAIFFTLWKMTPKKDYRINAVKSYQQLYEETQSYDYKACLKEMNVSI